MARRAWLSRQRFALAAAQLTFDTYLHALDLVDRRIEALERAIAETAEQGPWRELVAGLRCLRGVDTLTALALVAEVGDFALFGRAQELTAFVGLVPSEHSSGEQPAGLDHQGRQRPRPPAAGRLPGTRVGARRCATSSPPPARPGGRRGRARLALPAAPLRPLAADGRPRQAQQKIVVACARELAGFVWAIATEQPFRSA